MGNRLLDWFSVLMADAKKDRYSGKRRKLVKSTARFPSTCKPEVRWMFAHLDTNADEQLSVPELYDLEHDKSEHCIKPFLDQCNMDRFVIYIAVLGIIFKMNINRNHKSQILPVT
jgi:sparc/osteonectin, cwcv and kazal-like domains proteoglycan (testican)